MSPNGVFKTEDDAKSALVYIATISGLIAAIFTPFLAVVGDMVNPKILTPLSFLFRGLTLISIVFINNPLSLTSYIIWAI